MNVQNTALVERTVVAKWDRYHASGSNKDFPNLDLVRLKHWFFGAGTGELLEYGFGCGVNLIFLLEGGYKVEAIDASIEAKKNVEKRLTSHPELAKNVALRHLDLRAERLPYEDGSFDFITCISVLSLLGNKERAQALLGEFRRVLKHNGKIIVDINGHKSDFARKAEKLPNDVFKFRWHVQEEPNFCYCLSSAESFAELVSPYLKVDDLGYSSHKYFDSEIEEFIVCGHKA